MKYFPIAIAVVMFFSSCKKDPMNGRNQYPTYGLISNNTGLSMKCGDYCINAFNDFAQLQGYNFFDTANHYYVLTGSGSGYLITIKLRCQSLSSGTYVLDYKNDAVTLSWLSSPTTWSEIGYATDFTFTLKSNYNIFSGDFSGTLRDLYDGRSKQITGGIANMYLRWIN